MRTASVPLLLLVALALAGCGPTPAPGATPSDPRPTGTSTPIPLPVPTETLPPEAPEPLDTVTRILLLTEHLYFCDDIACAVDGFRYDDAPDLAIVKLTAVFEVEPTVESYEGVAGSTSYAYRWGDDFLLYFSTGGGSDVDHLLRVDVTTASFAGVAIETEHGVRVGMPMSEAIALADYSDASPSESGEVYAAYFDLAGEPGGTWTAIVAFRPDDTTGPVTDLVGPITTSGSLG